MTWIIFTILFGIVFWAGVAVAVSGHQTAEEKAAESSSFVSSAQLRRLWGGGAAGVAAVAWVVLTFALMLHTVGQRQIGIVYNFSGTISGKKDPGVIMTAPWQHIRHENVGIQSEEFDLGVDNSAVSRDQQPVYARLFLNFQVEPAHVVDLYKTVGPQWKHILLDARVLQDFKETTASFDAAAITVNRAALRAETRARLVAELKPYDVHVVDFFVKNVGFSKAYGDAITARNVQKQKALQAEAKVAQVQAEAAQAVAQAKGQATATAERAAGEAKAIAVKGRALKNNPQVLALTSIEKLNPNVKVIYVPTGSGLFLPGSVAGK